MLVFFFIIIATGIAVGYYVIGLRKENDDAYLKKYEKLENEGKFEDVIHDLETKLTSNKLSLNGLWKLVSLLEKTNRPAKALEVLFDVIENKRYNKTINEYEVKKKLAILLFRFGKDEESLKLLLELVNEKKDDTSVLFFVSLILMGQKRFETALKFLQEILKYERKDSNVFSLLSICHTMIGEIKKGKDSMETAIFLKESPDPKLTFILAIIEYLKKDYRKSITNLNKLQDLKNNKEIKVNVMRVLGHILTFDNDSYTGVEYFKKAIEFSKDEGLQDLNISSNIDLVMINLKNRRYQEAKKIIETIKDKIPEKEKYTEYEEMMTHLISKNGTGREDDPEFIKCQNLAKEWHESYLSKNLIWSFAGLEREPFFNTEKYITDEYFEKEFVDEQILNLNPMIDQLTQTDRNKFKETAKEVLKKLGLEIIEENYRSDDVLFSMGDGMDFIAQPKTEPQIRYLVQFRRWNTDNIGELVLKNLEDQVKMYNLSKGLFITSGNLSEEALNFIERSKIVNVVQKNQLEYLLNGIYPRN